MDKHQEWTGGAQSTKSTGKGTVILSSNSADDKTSVCCMDLQAVVLTPRISRKQNSVFITLPRHKGCSGYLWDERESALTANGFASSVTADNLLQIILDFQRTFCIAMGPPIRTDTPSSQRLCIFCSHTQCGGRARYLGKGHT